MSHSGRSGLVPAFCFLLLASVAGCTDWEKKTPALGSAKPLLLVQDGVGHVSIRKIDDGTPSAVEEYAAEQLQEAFRLASGVTPPIDPAAPAEVEIRLGLAKRFAAGVGHPSDQAYAVRRAGAHIELVGNSPAAVMWAVADFSRQFLHVAWPIANDVMVLTQGPQSTVVVGQISRIEAPDFDIRGWIVGANIDGYHYSHEIGNWMAHNRQNTLHNRIDYMHQGSAYDKMVARGIDVETTGHTFVMLIPAEVYYDEENHPESYHPEYFPLIDGERVRPGYASLHLQLCLSNREVFDIVVDKIVQGFVEYPELKVYGVGQNDGSGGWCECDHCRAMDGAQAGTRAYSNRLFTFINAVADTIGRIYPDKYIGTFAGGSPPDFDIRDNVAVTFIQAGSNYLKKLTDPDDPLNARVMTSLTGWLSRSKNVHFWAHYWTSGTNSCPAPFARTVVEGLSELRDLGLKGICGETRPPYWPGQRLFFYAMARAGWDTSLAFDQILEDYSREAYGPAAAPMKSFYLLYEARIYDEVQVLPRDGASEQLFPPAFSSVDMDSLGRYLANAELAAAGGPTAYIDAVAEVRGMFDKFKALSVDPADIPGIGPNLVANPGAEADSSGWLTNVLFDMGDYVFATPAGDAHSGRRSFAIECTGEAGQAARWYQVEIPVTEGKKYAVRAWIRASDGASGAVEVYAPKRIPLGWVDSGDEWVRLVLPEFTATGSTIGIYPTSHRRGTVYFDDLFVAELPD